MADNLAQLLRSLVGSLQDTSDPGVVWRRLFDDADLTPSDLGVLGSSLRRALVERAVDLQADETQLRCSFCLRGQDEVRALVAGPNCSICDGCIEIARSAIPRTGLRRFIFGPSEGLRLKGP